jgi:hypothetical protein
MGDQIAFDDIRIHDSQPTRFEGMSGEATPFTEETHLVSPTVLAQFSPHQSVAFADGPKRVRRTVRLRRADRGVRRHDCYFFPWNVKSCVWVPVTVLTLDVTVTVLPDAIDAS